MPRRNAPLGWDDLRLVLATARGGNLRKTAATLGVDATTIGRRLAAIDERVGYTLFERAGTALTLTPAARILVGDLEAMEVAALGVERKLAASVQPTGGVVRVAASDSFSMHYLMGLLAPLRTELPDIVVALVTSAGFADLNRREADIALRFARPTAGDLLIQRLATIRWSLYGAASYLASRPRADPQRGLMGHELIRWGGPALRPVVNSWLDAHASATTTRLTCNQLHVMFEACASGLGLAVLPGVTAIERGLVRAIDHAIDENELYLVMHRDSRKVPRIRSVADWLGARLRGSAHRIHEI